MLSIASSLSLALGVTACGNASAQHRTALTATSRASTTTAARVAVPQPFGGSGSSILMRTSKSTFALVDGTVVVAGFGHVKFQETGTFTGFEKWTAQGTMTAANGDAIRFTSIGGVRSDTANYSESKTNETITGGTGRFAGAHGTTNTVGRTVVNAVGVQVYTFHFSGSIFTNG
jgi:hypothetical protein